MAAFKPFGVITQSQDGKTITFTDTSNYGVNTDGAVLANMVSRQIIVKDVNGVTLQTLTLPANQTTISFLITKDLYLSFILNFVRAGNIAVDSVTINWFSIKFWYLAWIVSVRNLDCACKAPKDVCSNITKSYLTAQAAQAEYQFNPALAQKDIDAALAYLSKEGCGC